MQLSDYAQALGAAQRLVPNFRDQEQQDAQTAILRLQPQLMQQQMDLAASKAAYEDQRRGAFQSSLAALGARPTPDKLYQLGAQFPEFGSTITRAAEGISQEQRSAVVRQLAPIQALIQNKRYDQAAAEVKRHIDADLAAGLPADETDQELYAELTSGDPQRQRAAGGVVYGLLAAVNPDTAASNIQKRIEHVERRSTLAPGNRLLDAEGNLIASAPFAPDRFTLGPNQTRFESGTEGGGLASSGGAAGRDVSRLINSDAGGGQVPDSVQTLGQFVNWGRALNRQGATSSSAGTYQINGSTMADFAPRVLGADWRNAPFNAENQDRVGKAIFDWAKRQANPAQALRNRWVALSPDQASRLVQGDWEQARDTIAREESGGGPGASAAPVRGSGGARAVASAPANVRDGYRLLTPDENQARGLDPNIKYQEGPNGQLTALGGQNLAQLKPIPPAAADAMVSNRSSISNIDRAIRLLDPRNQSQEAKNARYAIGTSNRFIPDAILQNTNPDGVSFRAKIGQIGGLLIKDISGAAVSASEDNRLAKWVPLVTDTPRAALDKLKNLRQELVTKNNTIASTYSREQGYRDPSQAPSQQPQQGAFRIIRVRPK